MTLKEFKEIIKNQKPGDKFKAHVDQSGDLNVLEGVIHIGKEKFWLCFNEGHNGDPAPTKHGYRYSWVITNDNRSSIKSISFISPEPVIINNYSIY